MPRICLASRLPFICLLLVTSPVGPGATEAPPELITRAYDVRELFKVVGLPNLPRGDRRLRSGDEPVGTAKQNSVPEGDYLTWVIMMCVEPDTWKSSGGDVGEMRESRGQITATCTQEAHAQIEQLLGQLRKPLALTGNAIDPLKTHLGRAPTSDDEVVNIVYDMRPLPAKASGMQIIPGRTMRDEAVDALHKRMVENVAPGTWKTNMGDIGAARDWAGLLIVRQTAGAQRELYEKLREWARGRG